MSIIMLILYIIVNKYAYLCKITPFYTLLNPITIPSKAPQGVAGTPLMTAPKNVYDVGGMTVLPLTISS